MAWTPFCETKHTTSACTAEVGCHWLDPYSRCIPECAFGIDNRDACDTRYCSWRWTPKLPITGKCLECDAARKYETCDCGDASWGSASSRQTRGGRRNLKFGYVELNTGFVVEGSVELDGVTLADAEAQSAVFRDAVAALSLYAVADAARGFDAELALPGVRVVAGAEEAKSQAS